MSAQPIRRTPPGAEAAPFARILCAVDGSRGSDVAVLQALILAGPAGVTFIAVSDVHGAGAMQMATLGLRRAEDALAGARAAARSAGVAATTILEHAEDVRETLLEQAREYDLLVLGTHSATRPAGILLGDVAATALHRSPVPVLIARPEPPGSVFPVGVLAASDGTLEAMAAVDCAAAIAARHGGRVTIVHASGHAPAVIAEAARELPASLIVLGSRMLTGVRAVRSVSERVGQMAPCSVLVVRG